MDNKDLIGAGIGSGLIGAVVFGVIALMAIQFQLQEPILAYSVLLAASVGATIFAVIGQAAARRLPRRRV